MIIQMLVQVQYNIRYQFVLYDGRSYNIQTIVSNDVMHKDVHLLAADKGWYNIVLLCSEAEFLLMNVEKHLYKYLYSYSHKYKYKHGVPDTKYKYWSILVLYLYLEVRARTVVVKVLATLQARELQYLLSTTS